MAMTGVAAAAAAAATVFVSLRVMEPAPASPAGPVIAGTLTTTAGSVWIDERPAAAGTAVPAGATLRTSEDGRAALRLASGADLRTDVGTDLRFTAAAAISLARGAVFFDSGTATGPRLIEVETPLGVARDVGTRFEVRLVGGDMRVRVREGRVDVATGAASLSATAGVELVAAPDRSIARHSAPVTGTDWDWVTLAAQPFEIEGRTLQEFLAWVSREGGWQTTFATDALARSAPPIVLRGSIGRVTPREALELVLPTCGLAHRIEGTTLIVFAAAGGRS
jgi:ferric-dicitrate binding protein FerR (iron transport regulator)